MRDGNVSHVAGWARMIVTARKHQKVAQRVGEPLPKDCGFGGTTKSFPILMEIEWFQETYTKRQMRGIEHICRRRIRLG
jgi:hypothetical protein